MVQLSDSSPTSEGSSDSPSSQRTQTINVGRWSAAEDSRLREAVIKHGNRWIAVAPEVGTRNSEQCAKRWNDNLNPSLDHSFWSTEEDKLLLHLVNLYGHNWKLMTESSFQARSPLSLKNRYCLLQRRQKRQSKRRQQTSSKSGDDSASMITPPSDLQSPSNADLNSMSYPPFSTASPGSSLSFSTTQIGAQSNLMGSSNGDLDMAGMFPGNGFANMQNSFGTAQFTSAIATVGSVGQGSIHGRDQGPAHTGWDRHDFCNSIDLDSLFNGTDLSLHLDNASNGMLDRQRPSDTGKPKDKGMEVSVTCSRSRLKAMVCHAFESAMTETRGLSEEDQVTVTLRLKR